MSDAVGWGFVVRGNGPCHIQAVEPSGPAAAAGLKVGIMGNVVRGHLLELKLHAFVPLVQLTQTLKQRSEGGSCSDASMCGGEEDVVMSSLWQKSKVIT